MNEHDCHPQMAEGLLGSQLVNRSIQSNMVIAPIPSETCLLKALIPMDQVPSNPRHPRDQFGESSLWELLVFFSEHGTHREVWESIFPGGVCSVIYQFCRLS